MRKVLQCCFLWLLLCVAGGAVAGTVKTIEAGTHTLESGNVYQMSVAKETGVTKAWTLSAAGSVLGPSSNVALQVNLGSGNNTVILNLTGYLPQTDSLQDENNKYVPALKVTGKGTLIIRHSGTKSVYLRITDKEKREQPAIDLSGMTGGEVRFERAAGATGWIELQRVWGNADLALTSGGLSATPVIVGDEDAQVRIVFAPGVKVRFFNCVYVKATGSVRELPAMISEGYEALRIEEGAEVRLYHYRATTPMVTEAKNKGWSWTAHDLFPKAITLAGGSLVLYPMVLDPTTSTNLIAIPQTEIDKVVAAAIGQGSVFGKTLLTVSAKYSVVPEACIKVAEGQTLDEAERTTDEKGRLVITKSPELVYASSVSASDQEAVTLFGLTPEITEAGCTVICNFGIAELKVDQVDSANFLSTLKISVDLPTETASTRSLYLRILQTAPNGTVSTIYPASGTGTAALTTFTRDAADSIRFSASVPCCITPSLGTTAITIRAYATPPAE